MPKGIYKRERKKNWLNFYEKQPNGCWNATCYIKENGYAYVVKGSKTDVFNVYCYNKKDDIITQSKNYADYNFGGVDNE